METAEKLQEKIDLLELSDDERTKLEEKFVSSLVFVSTNEIKAVLDLLAKKGEKITRAREVKILTNPVGKIEKNYDFIEEAHEPGIYSEDLIRLNANGLDIFKRITYCNQFDIPYKNEDGTYKSFLFNESLFQKEINGPMNTDEISMTDENPTEINESNINDENMDNDELGYINTEEPEEENSQDYVQAEADLDDIESQTTSFAAIKSALEQQLAELDAARTQSEYQDNDNVFHFNDYADIEGETYNVGRGR